MPDGVVPLMPEPVPDVLAMVASLQSAAGGVGRAVHALPCAGWACWSRHRLMCPRSGRLFVLECIHAGGRTAIRHVEVQQASKEATRSMSTGSEQALS